MSDVVGASFESVEHELARIKELSADRRRHLLRVIPDLFQRMLELGEAVREFQRESQYFLDEEDRRLRELEVRLAYMHGVVEVASHTKVEKKVKKKRGRTTVSKKLKKLRGARGWRRQRR
jgi:uncharacterized coiled-coil protein SlyX